MKTINVDADPANANWPKRTDDTYAGLGMFGMKKTKKAKSVTVPSAMAKKVKKKG